MMARKLCTTTVSERLRRVLNNFRKKWPLAYDDAKGWIAWNELRKRWFAHLEATGKIDEATQKLLRKVGLLERAAKKPASSSLRRPLRRSP